ncbi:MAG TPA: hypothetical protein VMX38_08180 [Verrucomicrobiae bacterium]|jgi:hypothetical protein|nr:hypothetical protein [Verrucomicrobiae bacterium]
MASLRMLAEAFGIFAVSIILLFVAYTVTEKRATGIGWLHWKGMC